MHPRALPLKPLPTDEFASLSVARAYVDTVQENIRSLGEGELIEALERLDRAYNEFPELELDFPRSELLEDLRCAAESMPDQTGLLLLVYCVATSPYCSPSLASLAEKMIKEDDSPWLSAILRLLHGREVCWRAIESIVTHLWRQGRQNAVVQPISEVLGHTKFINEASSAEFGNILKGLLGNQHGLGIDSALLAQTVRSAWRRLSYTFPVRNETGSRAVLLATAERLSHTLSSARLSPYSDLGWPSGRMSFDEFLLQWPCEIELPVGLDDTTLIVEAYRTILLREPEIIEKDQYLRLLQNGAVSKSWIVEDLLASDELRSLERRVRVICGGQVITEPGSSGEEEFRSVTWPWRFDV
jgi:hypothetical protein